MRHEAVPASRRVERQWETNEKRFNKEVSGKEERDYYAGEPGIEAFPEQHREMADLCQRASALGLRYVHLSIYMIFRY